MSFVKWNPSSVPTDPARLARLNEMYGEETETNPAKIAHINATYRKVKVVFYDPDGNKYEDSGDEEDVFMCENWHDADGDRAKANGDHPEDYYIGNNKWWST